MPKRFNTGELISEPGTYLVIHEPHRLPREVVLLKDERFPRCSRCDQAVEFEFISSNGFLHQPLRIFELPVVDRDF